MAQSSDALAEFRSETVRGRPGYFRVARNAAGQWWFIDPAGRPFFARAVHGVSVADPQPDPVARLREWGFNTLGCDGGRWTGAGGLAFLGTVDFCVAGGPLRRAGVRLPDVFDAAWPAQAMARAAAICAPQAENPRVLGWLTDDGARWAVQPAVDHPGLLQVCLSLEPGLAAYHAAWEFVLALHQGRLDELAGSWEVPLPNKETLRAMTRQERGIVTRGYLRDHERWVGEFARRYFRFAATAIRAQAPHHLVLGCRWHGPVGPVWWEACSASVDVALAGLEELPDHARAPVLLDAVDWTGGGLARGGVPPVSTPTTAVASALPPGRLALSRAVAHPAVVGYAWNRWQDRPGEEAPTGSGLVHGNGIEACEHTEWLTALHDRVDDFRTMALIPEETP